jgi:hypothetical protein
MNAGLAGSIGPHINQHSHLPPMTKFDDIAPVPALFGIFARDFGGLTTMFGQKQGCRVSLIAAMDVRRWLHEERCNINALLPFQAEWRTRH